MTGPHPTPQDPAASRPPGPNQWFKDHLDALIDAELIVDVPTTTAATAAGAGRTPWPPWRRPFRRRA
ncbi:hypothetical protein [Streptacidiphilus jiangxiensis]|uniref:Uncharacterized protein n=1 Tax=Streptacidiphilus jiangxiensis TaxID=235985 RepID=A0A1H7ZMV8_STRJI|nr:hypothetical protein [Streptacidiphilus jiangxiensis]SEM59613.1 hypothetical protein SAMN05414137_13638 [Streptacidiphilus jiangxiensis]